MRWTAEKLIEFEDEVIKDFEDGKINCPIHLSGGNESQLIGVFEFIKHEDYVFSGHRSHYHYLLKGGDPFKLKLELRGKSEGICRGKGRSMHIFDVENHFFTSAIIGGYCAIAVGVAVALKKEQQQRRKHKPHVWCFVGDGTEDHGHYIESLRYAQGKKLPITFVVEDNNLAIETTKDQRWGQHYPIESPNVIRYKYVRRYPHVGVGKFVGF